MLSLKHTSSSDLGKKAGSGSPAARPSRLRAAFYYGGIIHNQAGTRFYIHAYTYSIQDRNCKRSPDFAWRKRHPRPCDSRTGNLVTLSVPLHALPSFSRPRTKWAFTHTQRCLTFDSYFYPSSLFIVIFIFIIHPRQFSFASRRNSSD